ncbi:NAD-dependent epimerase/dehydratase family protein [Corynebacterium lowii]|uniref:NAD-dependent epimerase/dehydratase family protein n=1 Tax=Corynebacterium lowii TaxID=1544413 RepID=UPI0012E1401E
MNTSNTHFPVVAITGSSGLVGSKLTRYLRWQGHTVIPLVRKGPRASFAYGTPRIPTPRYCGV